MSDWISVKVRMPTEGERVLVFHSDYVVRIGIQEKGVFPSVLNRNLERADVLYWMPMPDMPEHLKFNSK